MTKTIYDSKLLDLLAQHGHAAAFSFAGLVLNKPMKPWEALPKKTKDAYRAAAESTLWWEDRLRQGETPSSYDHFSMAGHALRRVLPVVDLYRDKKGNAQLLRVFASAVRDGMQVMREANRIRVEFEAVVGPQFRLERKKAAARAAKKRERAAKTG